MTFKTKEGLCWLAMIAIGVILMMLTSCNVNPSKLPENYIEKFAQNVRCAKGYKGKCWCFVASRKTGSGSSTGIGMTLGPDELCR